MKRSLLIAAVSMIALLSQVALAPKASWAGEDNDKTIQLLFVQDAQDFAFAGGRMTLKGVNPITAFFIHRPDRIDGTLTTKEFIPLWSEWEKSFLVDPVHATLSIVGDSKLTELALVLRSPQLTGDELTYNVDVLQGSAPAKGGLCSLFIESN